MSAPNALTKILNKIKQAAVPSVFNADFLSTVLGFKGGNDRTFISWAKKCGILNTDGTPTDLYKKFRNSATSGYAMASAIKIGYEELFRRNEYANKLNPKDIKGHIIEITGVSAENSTAEKTLQTFLNALDFADFDAVNGTIGDYEDEEESTSSVEASVADSKQSVKDHSSQLKLGLNYTINIVLPKSDDPKVYSAIFKSLKENLLDS
ncbi:hypothetical protein A6R74_06970 [Halomonas sp. ALS9]|nr:MULTISPECIES: DUF5343 domain-containing protein [unclassified Halomonas]OAL58627.1 hypothetical protein A6R74_06970 [Halomonas sp. ALS9]